MNYESYIDNFVQRFPGDYRHSSTCALETQDRKFRYYSSGKLERC